MTTPHISTDDRGLAAVRLAKLVGQKITSAKLQPKGMLGVDIETESGAKFVIGYTRYNRALSVWCCSDPDPGSEGIAT